MSEHNEIGRALVKSFIAVACGVVIATLGYLLTIALIIAVFFPDHARQMARDRSQPVEKVESDKGDSDAVFVPLELPTSLFAICPFIQALAAWGGGFVAARFAPAGRMGHGLLVAAVLLFNSIQMLLKEDPALPGWLISINTVVGPACALWGAAVAERFVPPGSNDPQNADPQDADLYRHEEDEQPVTPEE